MVSRQRSLDVRIEAGSDNKESKKHVSLEAQVITSSTKWKIADCRGALSNPCDKFCGNVLSNMKKDGTDLLP